LSEAAIFSGFVSLNTPCCRSSASLSWVTRCDQRFGDVLLAADFGRGDRGLPARAGFAFLPAVWRVAELRTRADFRAPAMFNSLLQRKTAASLIGSFCPVAGTRMPLRR
jgi:hypothetical protein